MSTTKPPRTQGRRADELRQRLEDDIVTGRRPPGLRLDETRLAAEFGVSRTPVREALLQLSSLGLIEMRPRQGAIVAPITVQQLLQMFEVMAELEAFCASLAARRMTPEERDTLARRHAACGEQAKDGEPEAYYEANRVFHEQIYSGAHNSYLEESTRALRNRLSGYRRFQLKHPGRMARSLTEHERVVTAILDGDSEAAGEAMRAHVSVQGDVFTDLVSSLPPAYVRPPENVLPGAG